MENPGSRLRAPRQARSKASLDRIVAAARELLEAKTWDQIGIDEIVDRADSSIGVFYSRFNGKEALFDYLDELYAGELTALVEQLAKETSDRSLTLKDVVSRLVQSLVGFHRRQPGFLRALVLHARMTRAPKFEERTERMNQLAGRAVQAMLDRKSEIRRKDAKRAAWLGFASVFSAMRDRILFPETIRLPHPISDAQLAGEMTSMLLAYLNRNDAEV